MSLILLHGEHEVHSRNALSTLINTRAANHSITHRFDAKSLEVAELETLCGTQSLFDEVPTIVIYQLLSLPKSKKLTRLIELANQASSSLDVILWEKKKLTAAQLKLFPSATAQLFPLSSALFAWLDQLHQRDTKKTATLLQQAVQSDGAEVCLTMLIRHTAMLFSSIAGTTVAGHPFMVQKVHKQATALGQHRAIHLHEQLTFLDYRHKTGQLTLSLAHSLERLMLEMGE